MPFIVDASVAGCWWLPDEYHVDAYALLDRLGAEPAVAPGLWWYEVRNLLLIAERKGRLDAAGSATFVADLARLPIVLDWDARSDVLLALARRHALSAYDAAYLELAARRGLPLATLDRSLGQAARAESIAVLPS